MEESAIDRPTPMTPENRRLLQVKIYGLEKIVHGDNWMGMALFYKVMYPGFTDDPCRAM